MKPDKSMSMLDMPEIAEPADDGRERGVVLHEERRDWREAVDNVAADDIRPGLTSVESRSRSG